MTTCGLCVIGWRGAHAGLGTPGKDGRANNNNQKKQQVHAPSRCLCVTGRSLSEKKSVLLYSFPKKACGHTMRWRWVVGGWWWLATVGGGWWWLAAVGGWGLVIDGGWQWLAVGGWLSLAVGGWWWLAVGGGWWLAVDGPSGWSLRAVLNEKNIVL